MNAIELLKLLIDKVSAYEENQSDKNGLSIQGFMQHIYRADELLELEHTLVRNPDSRHSEHPVQPPHIENNIDRVIAQHLILLNRYIKFYAKQVFDESRIKTLEEFTVLLTVMQHQKTTKTELIKHNIIEKSSGIEIINRLIKSGMLIQIPNPNDHRSQLVTLSESGQVELFGIFAQMDTLGKIATGNLNPYEKALLAATLKKLDNFHHRNYLDKTITTLHGYLSTDVERTTGADL